MFLHLLIKKEKKITRLYNVYIYIMASTKHSAVNVVCVRTKPTLN